MNETRPARIKGTSLPSVGHEKGQMHVQVLVTGINSQLGRALTTLLPQAGFEPTNVDPPEADIPNAATMSSWDWNGYDIIINAVAWTNMDGAETPEGRRLSWRANTIDPVNLARVVVRHGLALVHLSTEYTFDGATTPHTREGTPSPLGVYGQSEAAGDAAVSVCPQHYLMRTSWVVGDSKNFVETMFSPAERGVTLSVMADQTGRFAFASDLAAGIIHLPTVNIEFSTYDLSGDGPIVFWADAVKRVCEYVGHSSDKVTIITTEKYYAGQEGIAPQPLSSALDLAKIRATSFTPADSTERLETYLRGLLQVETDRLILPYPRLLSEISMRCEFAKCLRLPTMSRIETGAAPSRRPTVAGGFLLIPMLLTGLGWAVSSPVESSLDDNYRLGSIWCPRPADESCQTGVADGDLVVRVPITVADESMGCYTPQSNKSTGCALRHNGSHVVWSKCFDNGAHSIGYYHFHHLFVGKGVQISVLVMRGVNVLIAVTPLGAVSFCVPRQLRWPFIGTTVTSRVSMGVYFIASNSPNSWAVSGLMAYFVVIFMTPQQKGSHRIALVIRAVIGAMVCLTSKYNAAFFLLIVDLTLLFAVPWKREGWMGLSTLARVALLGVGTFVVSSQVLKAVYFLRTSGTSDPVKSADKQSFFEKLLVGLETVPKYLDGLWRHTWTPGWHDISLGARTPCILTIMAAGVFMAVGLRRGGWRKWTTLAITAGSMILPPVLFYANGAMDIIEFYQARYIFPLLTPTFSLMLAVDQDEGVRFTVPQVVWTTVFISLCQTITLHTLLLRLVQSAQE